MHSSLFEVVPLCVDGIVEMPSNLSYLLPFFFLPLSLFSPNVQGDGEVWLGRWRETTFNEILSKGRGESTSGRSRGDGDPTEVDGVTRR